MSPSRVQAELKPRLGKHGDEGIREHQLDPGAVPPASLLLSYWMVGCYFMGLKRFAELRAIDDPERAAAYRKSFAHYNESRLLVSVMFYAATAMLIDTAWYLLVAWVFSNPRWLAGLQKRSVWFERAFGVIRLGLAGRLLFETLAGR